MHRYTRTRFQSLVVIFLLTSLFSVSASAQPAPCPDAYPFDPAVGTCVDPETGQPVDPRTGQPLDPAVVTQPTPTPTPAPPEGDLASLSIYHLACDDDFDPDGVRDAGGLSSTNGCHTFGKPPFTYTISANGTVLVTSEVVGAERDFALYVVPGPIPAGAITISVAPVPGYTLEFVSCGLRSGAGATDVVEPPIAGSSATLDTLPGQEVQCWVFNVTRLPDSAGGDSGSGTGVDTGTGGGSVNMSFLSLACPAGTTIDAELDRICTEGLANVTYEILSETATLARNVTDGNGVLIFENVLDGQLAMVQSPPAGYGEPYVLCTHYSPTNGDREYAPTIEFGTGFRATVAPGDDLNCTWFNFPAAGPDNGPTIMIQTRPCEGYPDGFEAEIPLAEAESRCPGFSGNEQFQVSLDGQDVATARSNGINGQLTFTKLPVTDSGGSYGVSLVPGLIAQTVAVYCDRDNGDGIYVVVPSPLTAPNHIEQQLAPGQTMRCSWFINYDYGSGTGLPDATGTAASDQGPREVQPAIVLMARLCNPGADLSQSDINAACPTAGSGIAFTIATGNEPYLETSTNPDGVIDIPLPAGDTTFTITPQTPAGYGVPGYLCVSIRTGTGGGGKVVRLSPETPFHDVAWDSDSETTCTYYFPVAAEEDAEGPQGLVAEQEDQASPEAGDAQGDPAAQAAGEVEPGLTLQTLQCPPEVAGSDVALEEICTEPVIGLTFEILVDDVSVGTSVTDDAGNLAIPSDAGAGMYQFRHEPLPQYLEMKTACSSVYPNGSTASGRSGASRSQMGTMYLSYDDASRVTCVFYFVLDPAAAPAGEAADVPVDDASGDASEATEASAATSHRFTLQFWTCPSGVDLTAGPDLLRQACAIDSAERSFMLTIDGLTTGESITGATTWDFGTSPVYAEIGAGLTSSVWCDSSWEGEDQPATESQDAASLEGGMLTVTVTNPLTAVTCDWFITTS